jgi:hypothetical protein
MDQSPPRPSQLDRIPPELFADLLTPLTKLSQVGVGVEVRGRKRVVRRDRTAGGEERGMGGEASSESDGDAREDLCSLNGQSRHGMEKGNVVSAPRFAD